MYILRCKFTKEKDMVYISHLDLQRLLQRSLKRGNIKVSYSQGFNPHPKISFAQALSLGLPSFGEYIDIEIEEKMREEDFLNRINHVLPEGIRFLKTVYIDKSAPSLMSFISHGRYTIEFKLNKPMSEIQSRIKAFMLQDEIIDLKESKKGRIQEINIRPLIKEINIVAFEDNAVKLDTVIATGSSGNLKPSTLLKKLEEASHLEIEEDSIKIIREELYALEKESLNTPI